MVSERLVTAGKVVGAVAAMAGAAWAIATWGVDVSTAPAAIQSLEDRHRADTDTIVGHIEAHHDSLLDKQDLRHQEAHARRLDSLVQETRHEQRELGVELLSEIRLLRCETTDRCEGGGR